MKTNLRIPIIIFALFSFTVIFSCFAINRVTQVNQDRLNVKKVWLKDVESEHSLSPALYKDSIIFSLTPLTDKTQDPKESRSVKFFKLKNFQVSATLGIPQSLSRFIGVSQHTAIFTGWPWDEREQKIIAIDMQKKKIKWVSSVASNSSDFGYVPIRDIRVLNNYLAVLSYEGYTVDDYMVPPLQVTGSFVKILDLNDGKELSSVKYTSKISFLDSSDKNSLYIEDKNFIYRLNKDQQINKKLSLPLKGITPFFIAKDYYLYVDAKKETISKMVIDDKSTQKKLWSPWVSNIKTPDFPKYRLENTSIKKTFIFKDQIITLLEDDDDDGESIVVNGFLVSYSVKDGSLNWMSPSSWYYEMTPKIFLDRYLIFGDSNATRNLADDTTIIIDITSGNIVSKIKFPVRNTPSFEENTLILKGWKHIAQYKAFVN